MEGHVGAAETVAARAVATIEKRILKKRYRWCNGDFVVSVCIPRSDMSSKELLAKKKKKKKKKDDEDIGIVVR